MNDGFVHFASVHFFIGNDRTLECFSKIAAEFLFI